MTSPAEYPPTTTPLLPNQYSFTIAGISFLLSIEDQALQNEIDNWSLITSPPRSAINHSFASATISVIPSNTLNSSSAQTTSSRDFINGHDQFQGHFSAARSIGQVSISAMPRLPAFLNFIRQVITRIIFQNGGLVLHAASIAIGAEAYLFAGPSGAGKSTLCSFSDKGTVLSDDLTAIRLHNNAFLAWGLPGRGTGSPPPSYAKGSSPSITSPYTIRAICKLTQSTSVSLSPLAHSFAVASLLAIPQPAPSNLSIVLDILSNLTDHIPCYDLSFRKDPSFWPLLRKEIPPTITPETLGHTQ